ncbi:hypothetical protein QTP88_019176 [Uroleucon formosanum]
MGSIWSAERGRLSLAVLKELLNIKANSDLSCSQLNPTARKYFENIKLSDYASKEEIFIENEEYYVPSEGYKQLMYCVEPNIGIFSCRIGIYGKFCKHQAKLALGEKVINKTFYEGLLLAEVIHKQILESHDIHQDPIDTIDYVNDANKNRSTENIQIEK